MDKLESIIGFFYNIIPGLLFLYVNDYCLKVISIDSKISLSPGKIIIILALSLFVGFLFQSLMKIFRDNLGLNEHIFKKIKCDNEKLYRFGISKLARINRDDKSNLKINFYLMHGYLSALGKDRLPEHFSARLAFWSNIFFASLFTLLLFLANKPEHLTGMTHDATMLFIIISPIYSAGISLMYFKSMYSSILNIFTTKSL